MVVKMKINNISKDEPVEPEIELDGGYAYCVSCFTELEPRHDRCPKCGQKQDWSWFHQNFIE